MAGKVDIMYGNHFVVSPEPWFQRLVDCLHRVSKFYHVFVLIGILKILCYTKNVIKNNEYRSYQKKSVPILKKYGIKSAAIFGSVARGEDGPDSDIDMLVHLGDRMGIYKFIGLQFELENTLGKKVDLVSDKAINKYIKPYMEKDLTLIYER